MLWELLTHQLPWAGLDASTLFRQVSEGQRPPIPDEKAAGLALPARTPLFIAFFSTRPPMFLSLCPLIVSKFSVLSL